MADNLRHCTRLLPSPSKETRRLGWCEHPVACPQEFPRAYPERHGRRDQDRTARDTTQRLARKTHRLLMLGLLAQGRRSEALKHFRDLECLFKAELSVRPGPETTRLRDELLRAGDA